MPGVQESLLVSEIPWPRRELFLFNPTTTIEYSLPQRTQVTITVYNVLGEKVTTLANGMEGPGQHQVIFDGSRFASGTYLYVLQTDQTRIVKKMMLVK